MVLTNLGAVVGNKLRIKKTKKAEGLELHKEKEKQNF